MNKKIVKSNALIEACYSPGTHWGMRILLACLMQVNSKEALDYRKFYVVYSETLASLCGIKKGDNYRELKKAAGELRRMYISVHQRPNGEKGAPDVTEINLVSACQYFEKEGKIKLRFSLDIIPYISQLKNRFTQYQAAHVLPMRSRYGVRLYELCLRWPENEREFSVKEFKAVLGLTGKYERIDVLKRRVVNPAMKDINRFSDITVSFDQRKMGRKVSHFIFKITKPTKKMGREIDRAYIEKKALRGESWEAARRRLEAAQR